MSRFEQLKAQRKRILEIASLYGASNVRVFGSVARQDDDFKSDIDFIVDLEPGRSLFDLGGLLMDLQGFLGCPVDVITENGLRPKVRERILRDVVSL